MALVKKRMVPAFLIALLAAAFLWSAPSSAGGFAAWMLMNSGTTSDLNCIWGTAGNDVFAVGNSGVILHYDGNEWFLMNSGTGNDLHGIWGTDSTSVFAVGSGGTILHYDGTKWTAMHGSTSEDLACVWGTDGAGVFAVGDSGTICYFDGSTWDSLNSGTTADLHGIWGTDSTNVFAVGNSGTLLHFDGNNWTPVNSTLTSDLYTVWGTDDGDILAAGSAGTILRFNGSAWTALNSGTKNDLYSVWGTDGDDIFVAGESGIIMHYDSVIWNSMNRNTLNDLHSIWGFSSYDVFAAGKSGTILRYLPPVIESLSHDRGGQGEAMSITITGKNLAGASEVRFGPGIAVNSFNVLGPEHITVSITIVAGAETGERDVSVTTPGGSFTLPNSFLVQQGLPAISSVSPGHDRQGATLNVTITGKNLAETSEVRFGAGIAVNSFDVLSANQLVVSITIAADAEAGERDVSVSTPGGGFILPNSFTVKQALPVISSVSPDKGNQGSSLTITINGTNLTGATEVRLGEGITVDSLQSLSPNQIAVGISIAEEAELGTRDVSVTTPGGSFILPDSFTVKQKLPEITSISPDFGSQGAALNVIITGKNLTGAADLKFGPGIAVNSLDVISSSQLAAKITIMTSTDTGARDVTVVTSGGAFTLPKGFTVKQGLPVITSISPNYGSQGSVLTVIISGSNLNDAISVSFGSGTTVQSFTNISPTQLSVKLLVDENAVAGARDVSITTPGGSSNLGNSFSIKEKSTATLFIALLWAIIVIVIGLFALILHKLRKKRLFKSWSSKP